MSVPCPVAAVRPKGEARTRRKRTSHRAGTEGRGNAELLNILSPLDYFCGRFRVPGYSDDKRVPGELKSWWAK